MTHVFGNHLHFLCFSIPAPQKIVAKDAQVAESAQQLPSVALVYQTEGQTDGLTYGLGG